MQPNDGTWLADILSAARRIQRITAGLSRDEFESDELRTLSVERLLETMGEAAKNVSMEFREEHPEIPWRQIAGMRDVLIHAYRSIDPDQVWHAVTVSMPPLIAALESLLPSAES